MAKIFSFPNVDDEDIAVSKPKVKPLDGQRYIRDMMQDHLQVTEKFFNDNAKRLDKLAGLCAEALNNGNKLFFCGNGGSASDAMHIAAEFVGRFVGERRALPAIALTADNVAITSISNDYGYQSVFSRQIEALGQKGDVLIGLSTSGNSQNVLNAVIAARGKDLFTVGLAGHTGGTLNGMPHMTFIVEDETTARIQECHMTFLHMLCALVEDKMGLTGQNTSSSDDDL